MASRGFWRVILSGFSWFLVIVFFGQGVDTGGYMMLYKQHSVLVLANQWGYGLYYIIQPPTNNWRWRELVETWKKKLFIVATEGDGHLLVLSLQSVWNPIQDGGMMPHTSHSFTTPKEFGPKPDQYPSVNIKIAGILCCSSSSLKMPWVTHTVGTQYWSITINGGFLK